MLTPIPAREALLLATVAFAGLVRSQPAIDEALLSAARAVMPGDPSDELRAVLEAGLWHEGASAVAISIPRANEYMTLIFRRQPEGTYSAADASWVANTAFGFWGFPREEIERFETQPVRWQLSASGHLMVLIQTRGWRDGQRYTASGYFLVSPDGTVSGQ